MPTAYGTETRAVPYNIMLVTTTLATNKASLMLNWQT
jgi:hypothetical protein